MTSLTPATSLYLHIPFCRHRCAYCDFNTYAGLEELIPSYVGVLCAEIRQAGAAAGGRLPAHTVFFGGGTPSLLPLTGLEKIFAALEASFDLLPGVEITLEANPGTLTLEYLSGLRALGVNRLSLGMQSAHGEELRLLERTHDLGDVVQAVRWARLAGFANLNLDLIFGLPSQSLASWERSLKMALSLQPEHFSLYALTLEHDTPMAHWVQRGLLPEPDPDLAADMYELAMEVLGSHGYTQYEISNWARRSPAGSLLACQHNLQYWRSLPYLGFGAGAHGFAAGVRTANVLAPQTYIQRLQAPTHPLLPFPRTTATAEHRHLTRSDEIGEFMMMGLRLVEEGVSNQTFTQRFGVSLQEQFAPQIERLIRLGLLEWVEGESLRLTKPARLLGNQVFSEFV